MLVRPRAAAGIGSTTAKTVYTSHQLMLVRTPSPPTQAVSTHSASLPLLVPIITAGRRRMLISDEWWTVYAETLHTPTEINS